MQIKDHNSTASVLNFKLFSSLSMALLIILLLSACSSIGEGSAGSKLQKPSKQASAVSAKPASNVKIHNHPSNPCTDALAHSHAFEKEDHEHKYDCENTNEFVSNAHIHPATKGHRKYRHVHANGANKHSHHR